MQRIATLPVWQGLVCVAVAATAWGTGGAAASELFQSTGLGPIAVSFWRFACGVAFVALARYLRRPSRPVLTDARSRRGLVVTGVGLALYQTAYFGAVGFAGVAVATAVTLGAGPILTAAGSRIWLGERLGILGSLSVAAGFAGLLLLMWGGDSGTARSPLLGIALALLSAVGFAATTLFSRAQGRTAVSDPNGHALVALAVGTVCLAPFALATGLIPATFDPVRTWALIGYLGLVPTALAYCLFFIGLTVIRATTATVVTLVEPLTAAVIAVAFLGERMTVFAVIGVTVLLAAVLMQAAAERAQGRYSTSTPGTGSLPVSSGSNRVSPLRWRRKNADT